MIKIDNQGLKPEPVKKQDSNMIDLSLIGDAIAVKVSELTGKTVKSDSISLLYLSQTHNAIGYCSLQYDYYLKKGYPEQTPVYLYIDKDNSVIKMGDTLGMLDEAVNTLNSKGAGFIPANKAVNNH